jgi:hypothetical protein
VEPHSANELGDDWAIVTASTFSNAPLHVGDQGVDLAVTIRSMRPGDADAANGDERMYCVTVEVQGVKDQAGRLLGPSASPVTWTVARQDNDGSGFQLGRQGEPNSNLAVTGLRFDVKGIGAQPGKYNVTLRITYSMMNSQTAGDLTAFNEDEDNIQFEIVSNVAVGTPVPLNDNLVPVPLHAGATFQLLRIQLTTLSGPLGQLVATLSVPASGALQLSAPAGTTLTTTLARLTGTATLYFRVDVPIVDQGVYNASNANITLTLQYIRERNWNGSAASISAGEEGLPLVFAVDYTPLLNSTGAAPSVINRGTRVPNLTVSLRNEGNADLVRVTVSLDVSNYFSGGAYYYDGDGNRISVPLEQTIPSLKKGGVSSVVFPMAVFSSLPAGTHRLPVRYSGYFEKAGDSSSSSGLYPMSDSLFSQLRGAPPWVDITVLETGTRISIEPAFSAQAALNPGGESEGVAIRLDLRNDEKVVFRDAAVTMLSGSGTILRDPASPDARSLPPIRIGSLWPGETAQVVLIASLDRATAPGFQQVTARFNATNADSNAPVGMDQRFSVRVAPFGPSVSFSTDSSITLGGPTRGISVPVDVINSGQARLTDVWVRLRSGAPTPLVNPSDNSSQWLAARGLGLLDALSSAELTFTADLDPNTTAQIYQVGVELSGVYLSTGERFTSTGSFQLRVLPGPARLTVLGTSISPSTPQAGKTFTLSVRVKNVGDDTARGVWVALGDLAGGLPGWERQLQPPATPFSAEIALKHVGDLRPGDELSVAFNMLSDPGAPGGRLYRQPVVLGFDGAAGQSPSVTVPVTVKLKASPAPAQSFQPDLPMLLLTLGFVIVLGILLSVLIWPPAGRSRAAPARSMTVQDGTAPSELPVEIAVAKPVPSAEQRPLPPPPPPEFQARSEAGIPYNSAFPVPAGQLPPPPPPQPTYGSGGTAETGQPQRSSTPSHGAPPVAPPVADGGKMPEGMRPRAGPLENYSIAGADQDPRYAPPQKPKAYSGREVPMRACPSCGNEVKMRFVKCPICGADLPPVA